jgi:hypothetical protein
MHAIPTVVWLRPVNIDARVGELIAVVWNCVYFKPLSASRCIVGVSIGPPNGDSAPNPVSSHRMNMTFGAPLGAFGCSYGSQSGLESRRSRLIVPLNGLLMTGPLTRTATMFVVVVLASSLMSSASPAR